MKCPKLGCDQFLSKHPDTAEGIWDCTQCGSRWHIILTSQDDKRIQWKPPIITRSLQEVY